jgi:hypothetical protein
MKILFGSALLFSSLASFADCRTGEVHDYGSTRYVSVCADQVDDELKNITIEGMKVENRRKLAKIACGAFGFGRLDSIKTKKYHALKEPLKSEYTLQDFRYGHSAKKIEVFISSHGCGLLAELGEDF